MSFFGRFYRNDIRNLLLGMSDSVVVSESVGRELIMGFFVYLKGVFEKLKRQW